MGTAGVSRFVDLSMLGVDASGKQLGLVDQYMVLPLLLRSVLADHAGKLGTTLLKSRDEIRHLVQGSALVPAEP